MVASRHMVLLVLLVHYTCSWVAYKSCGFVCSHARMSLDTATFCWYTGYHSGVGKHKKKKDERGREKEQHGFAMRRMQALAATVHAGHRGDAVSSLVYEANARVRDPVYGCVAAISSFHRQIQALQAQLAVAHAQMAHLRTQNAAYLARVGLGHGQISMGGAGCSTSTGSSSSLSPKHHTLDMVALDQPGSKQAKRRRGRPRKVVAEEEDKLKKKKKKKKKKKADSGGEEEELKGAEEPSSSLAAPVADDDEGREEVGEMEPIQHQEEEDKPRSRTRRKSQQPRKST
ncbi:hypothetical protein B296_00013909 [Ensete ventricosum]|uniref:LOB domain-containing protein n=1 Tax=Ensete ventricosum TaxID=4639 RepID=A0A426Z3I5_ENSVE|nr:hypothetical protein B296_00013909 [Ensete ventricosum]